MTEPTAGAPIPLEGAANLRDLGGWSATGGVVRRGAIYRSTELAGLSDQGLATLNGLELRTVFDLRTTVERQAQPDRLPDGVADVHLDVLADEPGNAAAGAADLPKLLASPETVEAALGRTDVVALFSEAYRDIVSLPSALRSYRAMFTALVDSEATPALFHCTTGKDRTGWAAAALLSLLGVSRDDVYADYLATNIQILPLTQPMYDTFAQAGGDPDLLRPVLGVDARYLDTAFDEMTKRFADIEGYFTDGLGLDASVVDALRGSLVVAGS